MTRRDSTLTPEEKAVLDKVAPIFERLALELAGEIREHMGFLAESRKLSADLDRIRQKVGLLRAEFQEALQEAYEVGRADAENPLAPPLDPPSTPARERARALGWLIDAGGDRDAQ